MKPRVREVIGAAPRPCALCASADVVLVRSHNRGNLTERLLQRVDRDERTTATCRSCGGRSVLSGAELTARVVPVVGARLVSARTRTRR